MKIRILIVAIIVIIVAILAFRLFGSDRIVGSVVPSGEYYGTSTSSLIAGMNVVKTGVTTLGSVVVVSPNTATTFTIWNATSTTDSASTTVAIFPVNATSGTYVFDTILNRGLIIDEPTGFVGDILTTYR